MTHNDYYNYLQNEMKNAETYRSIPKEHISLWVDHKLFNDRDLYHDAALYDRRILKDSDFPCRIGNNCWHITGPELKYRQQYIEAFHKIRRDKGFFDFKITLVGA